MPSTLDQLDDPRRLYGDSFFQEARAAAEPAAPPISRQQNRMNRLKASDLAERGIPTFRNASGDVAPVTDETGAALTALDTRHNIAYDSRGAPKVISYDETGPPIVSDPFAKLPSRVNADTGAIEKTGPGGLYQYQGQDPAVTARLAQKARDKELTHQSSLLGRKLTLDEHDLMTGNKDLDETKKNLLTQVPTLSDPKYEGADLATVMKGIDEHFNAQYAAPEANNTKGWFGKELSEEATARRLQIDQAKAAAVANAEQHFALKDKVSNLDDTVASAREQERLQVETLLAHSEGRPGPLDAKPAALEKDHGGETMAARGLYPPEEEWSRMLGGEKAVEDVTAHIRTGSIPPIASAATVAVTHDIKDAQAKAEALKKSDPTLAEKYSNFATTMLQGLTSGLTEITKSMAQKPSWSMLLDPIRQAAVPGIAAEALITGKSMDEVRAMLTGQAEKVNTSMAKLVDDRLKDSIGTKAGHFIGGIAPFVGVALATKGKSIATPLMASLFYTSGYQRTYEDAKARGVSDDKAQAAGVVVGAINGVLALPLRTVGKAVEAIFGETTPKIVERQIKNAYDAGGAEGVYRILGQMATYLKEGRAGAYTSEAKKEVGAALESLMKEIMKTGAQRTLDVAKTMAGHAAIGAGVATAENLVQKTYNPEKGTFEGVAENAIGFGLLGGLSKSFEQVALARKAKQALDLINKGKGKPPGAPELPGPAGPTPPPEPPKGPPNESVSKQRSDAQKQPATSEPSTTGPSPAKSVDAKVTGSQPNVTDAKVQTSKTELLVAERRFVEEGGHADKLDAQNKLKALKKAFPDPVARIAAIQEHLAPVSETKPAAGETKVAEVTTVDEEAHTAATSPKNELAEPTQAQKEAGNYQKGHVTVGGLDIAIENPSGTKRQAHHVSLTAHYGYIKTAEGSDVGANGKKDKLDIFMAEKTPTDYDGPVYVVNQYDKTGKFDEHKAIIGPKTAQDAKALYASNYPKDWNGGKSVVEYPSTAEFKKAANSGAFARGKVAIDPRLGPSVGKVAAELHLTYGGVDAGGNHIFHDTSTPRATTLTIPQTMPGQEAVALRQKVDAVRKKMEGTPEQRAQAAEIAKRKAAREGKTDEQKSPATQGKLEPKTTESGDAGLAKPRPIESGGLLGAVQEGGGQARAAVSTTEGTRSSVEKAKETHAVIIKALGVPIVDGTFGRAGFKTEVDASSIALDHNAMAKAAADVEAVHGNGHQWIEDSLHEELTHVRDILATRAAGKDFGDLHRKFWTELSAEAKAAVRELYPDTKKASNFGGEYVRMVVQYRLNGRITESNFRGTEKIEPFLKRQQSPELEAHLKRMEGLAASFEAGQRTSETQKEDQNAITTGEQQKGEGAKLSRIPPRTDVRPDQGQVRKKPGGQTGSGGGAVERAPASPGTPGAGSPGGAPTIDEKAGQALDSAFEGLFAALPSREKAIQVLEQKAIPADKIGPFVVAAQELVRQAIDTPEKLAALLEARYQGKARPFSQALWDMLGTVKPALRGTHNWEAIYSQNIQGPALDEAAPTASNEAGGKVLSPAAVVTKAVKNRLLTTSALPRAELTKMAAGNGLSAKEADEAAELGIVQAAREIAHGSESVQEKFDKLVELYDRQPNLTAKTSTSKVNQAYSTPAPLAYAAGVMAGLPEAKSVYEPTAGNGLLTIAGDPKTIDVNELDPARAKNLEGQGFRTVASQDAVERLSDMNHDAVIANPPFGTILDDSGGSREFPLARTDDTTKNIDQAIALTALTHMKSDGRAVLILGGKNIKDPEERAKAYATPNQMKFWKPLYEQYQVVDHFTVDGDLYSKQGAGWPVDVVVIAGRGKSQIQLPSADGPRILGSWNELRNELARTDSDRINAGRYSPERHGAQVSELVSSIRGIAGPEPPARTEGDTEQPAPADGGARGSADLARPDQGQQPAVLPGPETGDSAPAGRTGAVDAGEVAGSTEQSGQQLGSFRVPYKPASKLPSFGIFVPTNMEVPAREALAKLEQSVGGSIDAYVREKLGYLADAPVERYFSAEQMDALALGVNAIENQTAFVLGDQGGVGKGRVAAGMMRYAIKQGKLPIFITKDVKLYAAMIEDLHDIGSDDITPLFTDNGVAFEDYAGHKWKQGSMRDVMKQIAKTGKLYGAEALFTTYSQIQTDLPSGYSASKAERASLKSSHKAPPDGVRMEALRRLAPGSIIIADESHLAAGDSIRAWRLAPLLAQAHGVYYSSATFAKRPDSMGIYSRTSLSHATSSMADLVDAMRQGGVPLQQVVSATLASDGLYLRRERDFGHAVFRTHINLETRDRDTGLADNYTDGLRSILSISNKMEQARKYLNKILRREGKQMHVENPPRVETTNFASKLHNLISQYLFAIKAEATVRRVVEGVTNGFTNVEGKTVPHKVVVTFQNTMEQPILALERSHRPLTFNGMLLHYLDSQRILTSGRGPGAQTIVITDKPDPKFERYTDRDLERLIIIPNPKDPENAGVNEPALAELFRRIMAGVFKETEAKLEALDLADMPLSPIDHLRRQLTLSGIKVAEITKRGTGIDEDGAIYKLDPSTNSKAAHLRYLKDFNDGDTQVLLMNASGSTGISAHASTKFKSQEPRAMLIVQPHLDINEFMQTLYRIDRTGQIHQPYYELLQTAIPAELRPAAILGRKMASLNANTTSNAENEVSTGNKGTDIFNQYGDEVVYNYLKSDPVFLNLLDMPKITSDDGDLIPIDDVARVYEEHGQFAAAVTGRAAVLPTAEQEVFWEKVMADYEAHIAYLNELGENELVSDTVDLKAETLESKELTPAKKGESGFDAPSVLEKIKADIGLKPLPASEVISMMEEIGSKAYDIQQGWRAKAAAWKKAELTRLSEKVLSWDDEKAASYEARWREQEEEISAAIDLIGDGLHIKTEKGMDGYGAITEVKFDDEHPLTPSKQIFTLAVNTTKKMLRVPASQLPSIARLAVGDFHDVYESTAERSNQRYMITGNLLAAYLAIRDAAPTAKIVQYTTDTGDLRQGILMPAKFSPGSLTKKRVVDSPQHMLKLLMAGRALTNAGGEVTLVKAPSGGFVMRVPSSRVQGGAYWRDAQLAKLIEGGEFVERGGAMIGKFNLDNSHLVYQRLLDLNASMFYTEEGEALGAARPVRAVKEFGASIEAVAKEVGLTAKESFRMLQHLVSPTTSVAMDAHDRVMKMLGERNQKAYETDRVLEAARQDFDGMPRPEQIAFIDRMKQGEAQPTPELQLVANTMRRIDTESWEAARGAYAALGFKDKEIPLKWLENHYRVLWKKIPGSNDAERAEWIGRSRRGLRGSMGQHKQHTLETISDGLMMGGKPYSYNPVEMFKLAQADLWKLTTTLRAWKWAKENGFVEFVRGAFPKAPDGMVELDDSIARVYFPAESGEGLIQGGKYFVEEGFGRLLNNYLSKDFIRATRLGRGLLWLKNATTSLELSMSPFHAVFETMETIGSSIGHGLTQLVNRGLLKGDLGAAAQGIHNMTTGAVASPVTNFMLGREIRKAAADPEAYFKTPAGKKMLKSYPRAREMIDDLFTGGWKPNELEQDWKNNSIRTFVEAVEDIRAGSSDNYVGAGLRAFPAANEMLMKPLFDYYIPSLKVAQFFKEYAEAMEQNERKLKGGVLTRAALARQVWRFVEDRFGEMNFDSLFWNANFKTAMQLMFRSVTWKLGSLEAFAGAFSGQGKEFKDAMRERRAPELHRNMAWLFGMFLLTATLGAIISITLGQKKPKTLTDYVFPQIDPKDDKVRVSLPTYFKDMVHLIHSPLRYVTSSMSGWIGRVADLLRNKDYYGVQIRDTDDPLVKQALQVGKYTGETLLPFSIRGYKNLSTQDVGALRKTLALLAINPAPRHISQSDAEERAEEYWKGRSTEAGISPEKFESAKAKRSIVAKLRHGQDPGISAALAAGTIKPADIKGLYQRAQMGALASQVLHMPLADAEKVYQRATLPERAQLEPVMAKKRKNAALHGRKAFRGF